MLALVVFITGVAYFWMKYLVATDDPFAVVNHPWQPAMLGVHVIASPWLVLLFGILLNSHILRKLKVPAVPNRKTGLTSLGTFLAMTLSGYLLQVVTDERVLQALVAVHASTGAVFGVAYGIHLVISLRLARTYSRGSLSVTSL
jgi:hypothetical protein